MYIKNDCHKQLYSNIHYHTYCYMYEHIEDLTSENFKYAILITKYSHQAVHRASKYILRTKNLCPLTDIFPSPSAIGNHNFTL